jgi:hypothetical protein
MRFVAVKNVAQQALLAMHRVRQGFIKARTAQGNRSEGSWANTDSSSLRASVTLPSGSLVVEKVTLQSF